MNILGISGSLHKESKNTALLRAASRMFPSTVDFEEVSIELPLYTGNEERGQLPDSVYALSGKVREADALFITTPEYNWSMTTAMKNFIDWMSLGGSNAPINNHVVALAGVGGGRLGSVRAQMAIRSSLLHNKVWVVPGPEVLIAPSDDLFDDKGDLTDDFANKLLQQLIGTLVEVAPQLRNLNA